MKILESIMWTLYLLKFVVIFSWIAHSIYLMYFPHNLNVYWNIISSVFLLFLDMFAHIIYWCRFTLSQGTLTVLCGLFLFFIGPVLLGLSLFGSLTDSINYDQAICRRGCVSVIQAMSIFFRDFHSVLLYIVSIFGLGSGFLFVISICCMGQRLGNLLGIDHVKNYRKSRTTSNIHEPLISSFFDDGNKENKMLLYRSLST